MENLEMNSPVDVDRAPGVGTLGRSPLKIVQRTPFEHRVGPPAARTPLAQRWQRAQAWLEVRGIGSPDIASLKLMLEAENVGAG